MSKTFKETVKDIKDAEKNVDKVLKAAKLERTPKKYDEEYIFGLIVMGMIIVFFLIAIFIMRGGV